MTSNKNNNTISINEVYVVDISNDINNISMCKSYNNNTPIACKYNSVSQTIIRHVKYINI